MTVPDIFCISYQCTKKQPIDIFRCYIIPYTNGFNDFATDSEPLPCLRLKILNITAISQSNGNCAMYYASHPDGRISNFDKFANSFIMIVHEEFLVVVWTLNSDWTKTTFSQTIVVKLFMNQSELDILPAGSRQPSLKLLWIVCQSRKPVKL